MNATHTQALAAALIAAIIPAAHGALAHRYSFAADATDSAGTAHGQLLNGAFVSGGDLVLGGGGQYVNLPNNLFAGHTSATIEVWITDNGSGSWSRIYDFGSATAGEDFPIGTASSGTRYMFLSPRSGPGTLRGAYTLTGGGAGEQIIEWSGTPLPAGVRKHVVWTTDGNAQVGFLYVDGVPVASNSFVSIKPSELEPTVNNWIGRSQFSADAFLNARIAEFRIYDTALDPLQVAIDAAAGPDNLLTNPGPVQAIDLRLNDAMVFGSGQQATVLADFAAVTNVNLSAVSGVIYSSSDTNVITVDAAGRLVAVDIGTAIITASYGGQSDAEPVTVSERGQTLVHRYSFATDARDTEGAAHGSLQGGATIANGAALLNGSTAFVDLPNNIVSSLNSVTLEAWATDNGSGNWARLWDFGNSTGGEGVSGTGTSYMFMAWPIGGGGGIRGAYKLTSTGEQLINATPRPAIGVPHHIVWTQDGPSQRARIYVDGVLVGENSAFTDTPALVGSTVNDWLGRSQFSADAYFWGAIDEFRIYEAALTPQEVAINNQLGPDVSSQSGPVTILIQPQDVIVGEQQPAVLSITYAGRRPVSLQWYRDGQRIPGATNSTYRIPVPRPSDSGAVFRVALTNTYASTVYGTVSSNAVLTVITDVIPPAVTRVVNVGRTNVQIRFSEPVELAGATNAANYVLSDGTAVNAASLAPDRTTVSLAVSPSLAFGSNYTVVLNSIRDRATTPNTIAPDTTVSFIATPFAPVDIGGATPAGTITAVDDGFDVTGSGADIGGAFDQFNFNYELRTGDFDVQVRVQGLSPTDLWSKAGLMARETLEANSPFAATLTTPNLAGSHFAYRSAAGARATPTGFFPPNFPATWLRLQRAGNEFTGYASFDGVTWTLLGSATMTLSNTLHVGMAVASHINGQLAAAEFRDIGPTASAIVGPLGEDREPPGPCSRRTGLVITEIMYNPAPRPDGRQLEFIEIFNSNPFYHDISHHRISGEVDYTFPAGTILPGGGFIVVAANPADVESVYGLAGVFGPYTNTLRQTGLVRLRDELNSVLLEIDYRNRHPWPVAADGAGHSMVLARPSYGEADPRAWDISDTVGGSPGGLDPYRPGPLRDVVINEVLAHTEDPGQPDYVELYNHSNRSNDISGYILTDNADVNKFIIPANTILPPRGFRVFSQDQLGFGLKADGDTIYFKNPGATRVLDAVRFDDQADGISLGRWPDGASAFYPMASRTPGAANSGVAIHDIVINELMYHPIFDNDDGQFIELHNQGTNTVNLSGWKLVDGVDFTIPENTFIGPNGYVVIGGNRNYLLANYTNLTPANTLGDFSGRLSYAGERVALARPEINVEINNGVPVTNVLEIVVDEVTYVDGGRWGRWADGGGSSLELIDPRADHRLAANWADSDETAKSVWTVIEETGVLDNGANYQPNIAYAQLGLLDAGECLVDDVEVRPGTIGANFVSNPHFEAGLAGWDLQGCFVRSSLEAGAGFGGGNALHLRTENRFFTGANSAQVALNNTGLGPGQTATLRFKARWLRGWPEAILRLTGNWLEAAGPMLVPPNLGTPGQRNSMAVSNAGPAIHEITHRPSMPAAGQPCVVVARVSDPDGLASFTLNYRVDPSLAYVPVPMNDDGTGGDTVAGDGVFSATIPGQAAGVLVAFRVNAADTRGATSVFPALPTDNGPVRECSVRFGEPTPASTFGTYHLWLTQQTVNRWNSLPDLSNEDLHGTLVYYNRVIYNADARYAGSPYHQSDRGAIFNGPANGPCHYTWAVPADDQLLGAVSFNKMHWIGNDIQDDTPFQNINDATLQREQTANTFLRGLGQPWVYRRYVAVYVNGARRGILMEDALRPSVSVPDQYFPNDTRGELYKVQPWFEFGPVPVDTVMPWANECWSFFMPVKTVGGAYKTERYRWWYQFREAPGSLSDYTNLYSLIDAGSAHSHPNYVAAMENLANMENWLRLVAANHAAGNWDCWGIQNGQNIYAYTSPNVKWTLFMFDLSIVLGNRISWGPGENLFVTPPAFNICPADANWAAIMNNPTFRRMYLRALKELVNGAMQPEQVEPLLDAKYAAFLADGLNTVQNPSPIKAWIAQARASIAAQVAAQDTAQFTLATPSVTASNNQAVISGRAPVEITTITLNGAVWPLTWTSPTAWRLQLPVDSGTSLYTVLGFDRFGNLVTATTHTVTVVNPALPESPVGNIVINEIQFNPLTPGAEYVELFNRSRETWFDLSGWVFNGLDYIFPAGSTIAPNGFLVLTKDRNAFAEAYGALVPVFDQFSGNLQRNGETITLLQPGLTPGQEVVIDKVRYDSERPWPVGPDDIITASSIELIDAAQDNSRPANWETLYSPAVYSEGYVQPATTNTGWRFVSVTGPNVAFGTTRLQIYLGEPGEVYLDDMALVIGTNAGVGPNLIRNGDFESPLYEASPLTNSWVVGTNYTNSAISTEFKHSGNCSLRLVSTFYGGPATNRIIFQNLSPAPDHRETATLSFWYLVTTNAENLFVRVQNAPGLSVATNVTPLVTPETYVPPELISPRVLTATPATPNRFATNLPAFPPLWLNEIQPLNLSGITDSAGERDPWIELHNAGTNAVNLEGLFLSDNYTNLTPWAFPAGASIGPGQFKVIFADGEPAQSTVDELHTSFRLSTSNGAVALSWLVNGEPRVLDYLNYPAVPVNQSYGSLPDGQLFDRQVMFYPTPGAPNSGATPPPAAAFINEWMAGNTRTLLDPADGQYDDWFELYNPGSTALDLTGYYLTDDLTDPLQFRIPAGYRIPPRGFLLIWADNDGNQNSTNRPDLHVDFRLSLNGEAIGLFSPEGVQVDAVTFGPQTNDVSQGRYPDAAAAFYFMPTPTPRAPNVIPVVPTQPQLRGISVTDGNSVFFLFSSRLGLRYQVEFTDDLSDPQWTPLDGVIPGTGGTIIVGDFITGDRQRFYRVVVVP